MLVFGWEHVQCVYYRPPTKLREGNVFSRVCLSGGDPILPLPTIHWTRSTGTPWTLGKHA